MPTASVPAVDVHCRTTAAARQEVQRRKRDPEFAGMITTCTPSPYGDFRVHSEPAEAVVEDLVDPIIPTQHRIGIWGKHRFR